MATTLRVRSPVIRTHQHGVAPDKELEATVTVLVPFPAKASAKSTHLSASAIVNMWQLLAGDCCGRQSCASRIPVRIWREEKCGARRKPRKSLNVGDECSSHYPSLLSISKCQL